jgi:restriction system protein
VSVPDFQTIMRPTLVALDGGQPVSVQDLRVAVAEALDVSEEDQAELLSSGKQTRFSNRVGWALTHMGKAGLVERVRRGYYTISPRGREVLAKNADRVDMNVLLTFPEYQEFRTPMVVATALESATSSAEEVVATELSPVEAVANIIQLDNDELAKEILDLILAQPPSFLERLALRLLAAMGYGGREGLTEHTGKSGDAGLDGLVRQDALGLELIGVQAKRYDKDQTVMRPAIQAFVGALQGAQTSRGVFITTGRFSVGARQFAENVAMRLVLIDGLELANAMILYNVGVSVRETFELKQISDDFLEE